ncbi:MAG: asparagine synthase (glutamine-hydrolyzing), partial [Actinobacteria bacterium]|nr:asparagine synthase (glutamine-hydrolyzing) [Actinomycetota bacterium]
MCGIAGIVDLRRDGDPERIATRVTAMLDTVRERGPDTSGTWSGDGVTLGHCRLRVIDLSPEADQPMVSASGDEVVVYNGEIYNHHLLRRELEQLGHRFRTRTDTEVLLHGYQEWGEDLVSRLSGMFAFALLDRPNQRLLLARDRLGKKPLYTAVTPSRFVFGTSVKCIVAGLEQAPEINYQALYEYLGLFSVPEEHCIYRGVAKVLPAEYAVLDLRQGNRRHKRYWSPQFYPKIGWSEELLGRVESTLRDAVSRRLESDVPLAVFLSGGIDSSLITAMAATEKPGVTTISARFSEASHDEGAYARAVADLYHTDHHEIHLKETSLDVMPELVWQYGEPFSDSSAIAQYQISKAARELATVVLTGDGGDELFGGYRRYTLAAPQIWLRDRLPETLLRGGVRAAGSFPSPVKDLAQRGFDRAPDAIRGALGSLDPANPPYFIFHTWFLDRDRLLSPSFKHSLMAGGYADSSPSAFARPCEPQRSFDRIFLADLAYWLPSAMLVKADVATSAASIEARSPLLDDLVVDLAARMEWRSKVGARRLKRALRELAGRMLPPEVAGKRKWGFIVPVDHWMRGESQTVFREILVGATARSRGLFDYDYVERVLNEHVAGRVNHKHRLWSLFCLEL